MSAPPHLAVDDVRTVARLAGLAPSVHGTQAWRFAWDGARFDVLADPGGALPELDPAGRDLAVGLGAAGLHARLGFAGLGWDTSTTVLPDGDDGEVQVRLQVHGPRASTPEELDLVAAIPRRGTDLDPHDERPVPREVVAAIEAAAAAEGGWTHVVGPDDLADLGVPLATADASAAPTTPPAEHPTVLVVGTQHDTRSDRVLSGFVLGRVLLRATLEGVAAQPVPSVLETPAPGGRLRTALRRVGHPQMVLRLGYGTAGPVSHRLPVDDLLTVRT